MRKAFVWLVLLNKRFFKNINYVIILLLIPVTIAALHVVSKEESGFVRIVLASVDPEDPVAAAITSDLIDSSHLVVFDSCDSADEARDLVKNGTYDAAWIFPEAMQERIHQFTKNPSVNNAIVSVIERKQNVPLRMTHEKLSAALYKYSSKGVFLNYIRNRFPALDQQTDSDLLEYYDGYVTDFHLFEQAYMNGAQPSEELQNANYLTTPIRGILSVIVVFCGLCAAMMYLSDEKQGSFAQIKLSNRIFVTVAYVFVAMFNVALIAMISLFIIGFNVSVLTEILSMLVLLVCASLFCTFFAVCFSNQNIFGALIPLFTVVMLIVCPVFMNLNELRAVQMLFPPTYSICSVYDSTYILYALVYCLLLGGLTAILYQRKKS